MAKRSVEYDTRNRLTHAWRSSTGLGTPGSSPGEWQKTQQLRYDISGNILCKSDVSPGIDCNTGTNYFYEGSGHAGPHAVTRVNTQAGHRSFQYDANGNVIQELSHGTEQRRMSYNPANLVRRVTTGNEWSEFHYGLDRQRSIRRDGSGAGSIDRRTHYIGNVEILRDGQGNLIEKRRYIAGVALMVIQAHGSTDTRYQHRDHLGSIIALSNEFGEIVAHMGFDAWGQRRGPHWDDPPWVQWTQAGTPTWAVAMLGHTSRGYTGHTHLDDHGIIHMNGRIYDPHLARFLQADPFVEDTATLNRYSYVHNNPLLYTDPSGYLSFKDIIKIAVVVVVSFYTGGAALLALKAGQYGAAIGWAALGGAISGGVMTGSMEGALWGAFSAITFLGVGQVTGGSLAAKEGIAGSTYSASDLARASVAHGIAGGTISKLQGGRFGHGALSAGVNKLVSPVIQNMGGSSYYQGTVSAIVGGSVSSISGGKFANGAVTAAMQYAFGGLMSRRSGSGFYDPTDAEMQASLEASGFWDLDTAIAWQWGDP